MYRRQLCLVGTISLLLFNSKIFAQFPLNNPSFEGMPGNLSSILPWDPCIAGVTFTSLTVGNTGPSHGSTYIRLGLIKYPTNEITGISQKLDCPMISGKTYSFTLDLRSADTSVAAPFNGQYASGELEIWCGNNKCTTGTLLWTSKRINTYNWRTDTVTFMAPTNCDYIYLRSSCTACVGAMNSQSGTRIDIDNMVALDTVYCPLVVSVTNKTVCLGKCETLKSTVSGGPAPYTYAWSNGLTTSSISVCPSTTTTYSVIVTDAIGQKDTAFVIVTVNPSLGCQPVCCVNGICEASRGERYPDCPDCPCYTAYDSSGSPKLFFNNPNPGTYVGYNSAKSNGMCYYYPDSILIPGKTMTFCFLYTQPAPPTTTIEIFVTPTGCPGMFQTITNQQNQTGGGICSHLQQGSNSNGFFLGNWNTYDTSPCKFRDNSIEVGCGHIPGNLYVVCVDVSIPANGICNGIEICPIINCYANVCGPQHLCSVSADVYGYKPTCPDRNDGRAVAVPCGTLKYKYLWDDPKAQTDSIATGLAPGVYHVTLTDTFLCDSVFTVTIPPADSVVVDAGRDTTVCANQPALLGGNPSGPTSSTYAWSPASGLNNANIGNPIATTSLSTRYYMLATTSVGCTALDSVMVNVNALPVVDAGPDKILCMGKADMLGGSPTGPSGSTYTWSPATNLDNPGLSNPSVSIKDKGVFPYTVVVTDGNGCVKSDDVVITVKGCAIIIPNIITPGGPGFNDKFKVRGLEDYPGSRLLVYDRWGLLMYESNDYRNDWDGRNMKTNALVPDGVYYYILYLSNEEKDIYKGFLHVLWDMN